jgi:hypothetical protein
VRAASTRPIVAIAGNAVENFVGIRLAARNRMDYALSVTLQSPVQIALGIGPLLVLISAGMGRGHLTLVFPPLMIVALAALVVFDGDSTTVEDACLAPVGFQNSAIGPDLGIPAEPPAVRLARSTVSGRFSGRK